MSDTVIKNDAESIFAQLSAAHPGVGRYEPMDQYRDFRAVFLGSEQGRRVLHEIMQRGHYFGPLTPKTPEIDPYALAMGEGARRLVLGITETMNKEPQAQRPARTNNTRGTT